MPRPYETVIIFDSVLEDSQVQEKIQRLSALVAPNGETPSASTCGASASSPIRSTRRSRIYAVLRYETEPTSLTEFERILRLDEQVLRQLTIVDPIIPTPPAVRTARPTEEDES